MPLTISNRPKPARQTKHLTVGCLIYPRMDQIDFTGPYEVLSRMPDSSMHIIAKTKNPVRDVQGLILTPEMSIGDAPALDVLLVPGGLGQQDLMEDEEVLSLIRAQADSGGLVFSVCTGALLCGAAGILRGRLATTHWTAWDLLPYYGAVATKARVVVDGNLVSCAGVTAGLDGALVLVSLLRGDSAAEQIQLNIQYAPDPIFQSGSPDSARPEVINACLAGYREIKASREAEARRFAKKFDVPVVEG